ncbi:MAG: Thymidylate kinase (EC [uncultured Thiotrichaceae bacterium]|uniref:Thymidylate kinase n=1 Tax=uncultured Thiotrichaceae bacterium TaxID=298394 RepID=A0A6S6TLL9_9GAMM|nr:MAG: Thymidylate kinase (EC [uncultured Thiotrichaceae bacterium]
MKKSLFITIEGVEGAGKTTSIPVIQETLSAYNEHIVLTREPGGTEVSEAIRETLLSQSLPAMHPDTELLLMFAARAEHLRSKIEPALAENKIVLCDRFTDSTYAYQGGGRGIADSRIKVLEKWTQGTLCADLTLYLDVDAATGLARTRIREHSDRFEDEDIAFFNRIRGKFHELMAEHPERYRLIDASQSISEVHQQIRDVLHTYLKERR